MGKQIIGSDKMDISQMKDTVNFAQQIQKAVTDGLKSKQLPPFDFVSQYWHHEISISQAQRTQFVDGRKLPPLPP